MTPRNPARRWRRQRASRRWRRTRSRIAGPRRIAARVAAGCRPVSGLASLDRPPSRPRLAGQWHVEGGPHWLTVAGAAAGWRGADIRAAPHSRFTRREGFAADTCGADCTPAARPSRASAARSAAPRACYNPRPSSIARPHGITTGPGAPAVPQKLYIRTFGCQMNEYDSDKMADVLAASDGLALTDRPEDADVILFNTCSVREKAQERVFHDLGRVRALKAAQPGPHHRRRRLRREPGRRRDRAARAVRRRRLRPADAAPPAAADPRPPRDRPRRRSTSRFPEIEKFDHLPPPRVDGAVGVRVDHGRLQQVLHVLRRALHARRGSLAAVRRRADRSRRPRRPGRRRKSRCSGRTSTPIAARCGGRGEIADLATLLEYIAEIPGIERIRYTTSHPKEMTPRADRRLRQRRQARLASASAGAVGLRPRAGGDEARLHGARIQVDRAPAARRAPGPVAHVRFHRRLSRARPTPISSRR